MHCIDLVNISPIQQYYCSVVSKPIQDIITANTCCRAIPKSLSTLHTIMHSVGIHKLTEVSLVMRARG